MPLPFWDYLLPLFIVRSIFLPIFLTSGNPRLVFRTLIDLKFLTCVLSNAWRTMPGEVPLSEGSIQCCLFLWLKQDETQKMSFCKEISIYDAIQISKQILFYNIPQIVSVVFFWNPYTSSFHFPNGVVGLKPTGSIIAQSSS